MSAAEKTPARNLFLPQVELTGMINRGIARRPWWLSAGDHGRLAAQLLGGERVSEAICRRLMAELRDPPAGQALARQIEDERRHQFLFRGYLELVGGEDDGDLPFAPALSAMDAWRGPSVALIVANHVLLEGDAVDATALLRSFPCPELSRICNAVVRDEARHVALGRTLLKRELPHVAPAWRREIYGWTQEMWYACATATLRRYGGTGALFFWLGGQTLDELWRRRSRRLRAAGFSGAPAQGRCR